MSVISSVQQQAWEKAYWFFANQDYSDADCEFYAEAFSKCVMQEMSGLESGLTLEDLFSDYVADVVFAERAEKEKERSLYA